MVAGQREGVREGDGESPLAVWGMGRKERERRVRKVAVVVGL